MSATGNYKPWRHNVRRRNLFGLSAVIVGLNLAFPLVAVNPWANGLLVLWLIGLAGYHHRRASARQHGQLVEGMQAPLAQHALEQAGYCVVTGKRLRNGGDVDLWVTKDGVGCVIEIKSFRYWRSRWRDRDRERRAVEQVVRQQAALQSEAGVIWLPLARPTFWQWLWGYSFAGKGVAVVRGNARYLPRAVRKKL